MLVVGHRGAAALAPENTLASLEAAARAGADGVELDVRLTKDDRLVLMHDDETVRTTGRPGRISEMTFADVRALNAAARFDGWSGTESVPTFEEALDVLGGRTGRLVVEIKGVIAPDRYVSAIPVARAVAPLLRDRPGLVVSSFDHDAVAEARRRIPHALTAITTYAFVGADANLAAAIAGGHDECHVAAPMIDETFVAGAHAAGRAVFAWVVDDPLRLRELRDMGCDGVFTDDPGAARAALEGAP